MKRMTIFLKMKGRNKAQREDKLWNLKRHIPGEFVIVAKFGDHALHCLASSLLNVIRQAGRQADKNFSLGDFFRIQYLAFGYYLVVFKRYSALVVPNYSVSMLFFAYDILRMVFMGGSFRGACHFWVDPY